MADRLFLEFEVLTPLFMGDADGAESVLRPPSLKGLLRFWYRTVALEYGKRDAEYSEARLFGGTGGQSPFLLRLREIVRKDWHWDSRQIGRFDTGQGKETRNGLRYLGYPFAARQQMSQERTAVAPGSRFELEIVFPRPATVAQRRAVLASAWLLGHVGGAGSRARRGFGSLALRRWEQVGADGAVLNTWDEWQHLPLLCQAKDAREWSAGFKRVKKLFLESWFKVDADPESDQPHFSHQSRSILTPRAGQDWEHVLENMGRKLQEFRVRRAPDYQMVKDHLTGQRRLEKVPERVAFGLPLTFRYSSVRTRPITFAPYDAKQKTTLERHGSLLHLRVVALADGLHALFLRLDGAIPGQGNSPVAPRGEGRALRPAESNLLDRFMDHLVGRN